MYNYKEIFEIAKVAIGAMNAAKTTVILPSCKCKSNKYIFTIVF